VKRRTDIFVIQLHSVLVNEIEMLAGSQYFADVRTAAHWTVEWHVY